MLVSGIIDVLEEMSQSIFELEEIIKNQSEKITALTKEYEAGNFYDFERSIVRKPRTQNAPRSADVWYDDSVVIDKKTLKTPLFDKKQEKSHKTRVERICKHCGAYIVAEYNVDEIEKIRIQCPKCKHFLLPETNLDSNSKGYKYDKFFPEDVKKLDEDELNEDFTWSWPTVVEDDVIDESSDKDQETFEDIIDSFVENTDTEESIVQVEDDILFNNSEIKEDTETTSKGKKVDTFDLPINLDDNEESIELKYTDNNEEDYLLSNREKGIKAEAFETSAPSQGKFIKENSVSNVKEKPLENKTEDKSKFYFDHSGDKKSLNTEIGKDLEESGATDVWNLTSPLGVENEISERNHSEDEHIKAKSEDENKDFVDIIKKELNEKLESENTSDFESDQKIEKEPEDFNQENFEENITWNSETSFKNNTEKSSFSPEQEPEAIIEETQKIEGDKKEQSDYWNSESYPNNDWENRGSKSSKSKEEKDTFPFLKTEEEVLEIIEEETPLPTIDTKQNNLSNSREDAKKDANEAKVLETVIEQKPQTEKTKVAKDVAQNFDFLEYTRRLFKRKDK